MRALWIVRPGGQKKSRGQGVKYRKYVSPPPSPKIQEMRVCASSLQKSKINAAGGMLGFFLFDKRPFDLRSLDLRSFDLRLIDLKDHLNLRSIGLKSFDLKYRFWQLERGREDSCNGGVWLYQFPLRRHSLFGIDRRFNYSLVQWFVSIMIRRSNDSSVQ